MSQQQRDMREALDLLTRIAEALERLANKPQTQRVSLGADDLPSLQARR